MIDPGPANAADLVTMSCRLGALAVVHSWGYPYRPAPGRDNFYFDAAIQMKRASYCADSQHFTVAGTRIYVADDQGIQRAAPPPGRVEAWWTPTGASCVNPANLRHREMGFTGTCNGRPLPPCGASLPPGRYLIDAPERPAR